MSICGVKGLNIDVRVCMCLIFAYFNPDKSRVLPHLISVDTTVSLNISLIICTHDVTCDAMNCAFVRSSRRNV